MISRATATGAAPVEGADVRTGPQHATTDRNGYYSIPGLTGSQADVFVAKSSYKSHRTTLMLSGDTRFDVQLVRLARYRLSGVVSELTPLGLVPVEGALVTGSWDAPVTTDSSGSFNIPGGIYESDEYDHSFFVIKDGYQTYTTTLRVSGDTRLEVQLVRN